MLKAVELVEDKKNSTDFFLSKIVPGIMVSGTKFYICSRDLVVCQDAPSTSSI